jgi:nitrogen regulation protein NR(I)
MGIILVVDDEPSVQYSFKRSFGSRHQVLTASSGHEALTIYDRHRPDVVFLDQRMPYMSGLETLAEIRKMDPQAVVVIMTAYGDTDTVIKAMQLGAFDYMAKPLDNDRLEGIIQRGVEARLSQQEHVLFEDSEAPKEARLIGHSPKMQQVYKLIGQVAATDSTVLIRGESGTGKELVARAIHNYSPRRNRPFVVVNCAAIPETLLESELFGYEKGAFSGATTRREGKFELADGGTLFLDEIGDMSLATQTKILRTLQERCFERLGGKETIKVDVRILSATNRDLEREIQKGSFREDLYWRLNVVTITLPPLRERKEDILSLLQYFAWRFKDECGCRVKGITREALNVLMKYNWPGNVRELENWVRRAMVLCRGEYLTSDGLPSLISFTSQEQAHKAHFLKQLSQILSLPFEDPDSIRPGSFHFIVEKVEEELVRNALRITGGNQLKAANLLGITRTTLRSKITRFNIRT